MNQPRREIAARNDSDYSKVRAATESVMWFRELHAFTRCREFAARAGSILAWRNDARAGGM